MHLMENISGYLYNRKIKFPVKCCPIIHFYTYLIYGRKEEQGFQMMIKEPEKRNVKENTLVLRRHEKKMSTLLKTMLNTVPLGITLIDENLRCIDCNESSLSLFKCDKQYYLEHFFELSPEYQPDGSKSCEKAKAFLKMAFDGEKIATEWTHRKRTGECFPAELTLIRIRHRDH